MIRIIDAFHELKLRVERGPVAAQDAHKVDAVRQRQITFCLI
jgi:hypothetical protein